MKNKYDTIRNRFNSLTIQQKISLVVTLGVLGIVLACISYYLILSTMKHWQRFKVLDTEYRTWLDNAKKTERELNQFPIQKYGSNTTHDYISVATNVEKIATEMGINFTTTKEKIITFKTCKIHQLKIILRDIYLSGLVEFVDRVTKIGDNVSLAEMKIQAQNDQLLYVEVMVATLEIEKTGQKNEKH